YLEIPSKNAVVPLKSTKATVQIVGKIAHVRITQTYQNNGKTPIEANYVFPLSTKAAVHDMAMTIGNRLIKAKVYEKKEAKKVYDKAIKQGKRASKLDQHRPNVFQMKVGNILPGDEITIDIYYTEMLTSKNGEYQFVFPGVVGPRFVGEKKNTETAFNTSHTQKGAADTFEYDINVSINAGMILQSVYSNSHDIDVNYPDAMTAELSLSENVVNPANRDFTLNYDVRSSSIQSGLLLYEGKEENYFSLLLEPSKKVISSEIPPREYLFVVDVSGSMMGYPIEVAKSLMKNLLGDLKETDAFNIILFSADNRVFKSNSVVANETNLKEAFQFLQGKFSNYGQGTYLLQALKKAYQLPRTDTSSARTMIVITDGYVNVEREAFELIENNLDKANVVSFGIGNGVNRYLIEGMSNAGKSHPFIATSKQDAYKVAKDFKKYIASPLLTQVKLETNGFEIYDVEPKTIPDVLSDRPIMIYGKYKGDASGTITLSGYQGKARVSQTIEVKNGRLSNNHKALKYLWARKKIERLDDYGKRFGDDVKKQVIELGLHYNLATRYTSFVAVDHEIVNKKGKLRKVKQSLPMPINVANSAVGVAAKIKGKSIYKRSYIIHIASEIENSQKRKIKMWFKSNCSKVINECLKNTRRLKYILTTTGEL
ncbi:MAG: VWA domain-containing protein, partial [Flavobacteriaceae bacterium]|nr:VWA domain-containing protein [Flavobacteriaceae bacterium]